MGDAGLGLAAEAEYVRAKRGRARQSPQATVCCLRAASLRAWSEAAESGTQGRKHRTRAWA